MIENMPAGQVEYIEQVAKFNVGDFDYLFERNGLQIKKVYGDYGLGEYNSGRSPRMILVAEKV